MPLTVLGIWRYPVKTLAGEPLTEAWLDGDGVRGDRIVKVHGPEGVRTSRRQYQLLGLRGTLRADGTPLVNGEPWHSEGAAAAVREAAGQDAWLAEDHSADRFDVLPLLVATDGAVAAFGRDIRRLRPNILVGGVEGMSEREWEGKHLRIGEVVIRLDSLRARCPMTTVDPDTITRDPEVLRDIARRFGGKLALNAAVVQPGMIRIDDVIHLE